MDKAVSIYSPASLLLPPLIALNGTGAVTSAAGVSGLSQDLSLAEWGLIHEKGVVGHSPIERQQLRGLCFGKAVRADTVSSSYKAETWLSFLQA